MPLSERAMENRRAYNRRYGVEKKAILAAASRAYTCTIRGRAGRIMQGAKRRAKEKGLDLNIDRHWIEQKLNNGVCERTGIPFVIAVEAHLLAPSLDRIDSSKGYDPSNCQVVCCAYNMGKKHMTDRDFEDFILLAAKHIRKARVTHA